MKHVQKRRNLLGRVSHFLDWEKIQFYSGVHDFQAVRIGGLRVGDLDFGLLKISGDAEGPWRWLSSSPNGRRVHVRSVKLDWKQSLHALNVANLNFSRDPEPVRQLRDRDRPLLERHREKRPQGAARVRRRHSEVPQAASFCHQVGTGPVAHISGWQVSSKAEMYRTSQMVSTSNFHHQP